MSYTELGELGRGTFGRVVLATDHVLGRERVAIKQLLDPDADIDRFAREIRLLVDQLDNEYVVNILRYELEASPPYFVMEYCEGGSVRALVGRSPWKQAAAILLCAANGLLGIHAVGGFHRDLKPDNILLGRNSAGIMIAKVADFGLARRPRTALPPMTRTPGGTEGYIAPEMSLPGAQFTATADVFSLGVVGVELLTGSLSSASLALVQAPEDFKNLLKRMVSMSWLRPSTTDVIVELSRIVRGEQAPKRVDPPLRSPTPAPQPRQQPGAGLFLAFGALLLGAAALAGGDKKAWDANVGRFRGDDGKFKSG